MDQAHYALRRGVVISGWMATRHSWSLGVTVLAAVLACTCGGNGSGSPMSQPPPPPPPSGPPPMLQLSTFVGGLNLPVGFEVPNDSTGRIFDSGRVWGLKQDANGNWQMTAVLTHNLTVSTFGQDAAGELCLVDYGPGAILRLLAAP